MDWELIAKEYWEYYYQEMLTHNVQDRSFDELDDDEKESIQAALKKLFEKYKNE